jgi:hypothetical protein
VAGLLAVLVGAAAAGGGSIPGSDAATGRHAVGDAGSGTSSGPLAVSALVEAIDDDPADDPADDTGGDAADPAPTEPDPGIPDTPTPDPAPPAPEGPAQRPAPRPGPTPAQIQAQRHAQAAARARAQAERRAAHARALAAHRAELAARRAAKARIAADRRAAQRASANTSAQATWARSGRPNQLAIVRGRHVDLVVDGRLTARVSRPAGPLTLAALSRLTPPGWLTLTDGVATLSASLALTAGTLLDNGPEVRTLVLRSGADTTTAAGIRVGRATLNLHDLTVLAPEPPAAPGPAGTGSAAPAGQHGYLVAGSGGTMTITDATLDGLGTPPPAKPPGPAPDTPSAAPGTPVGAPAAGAPAPAHAPGAPAPSPAPAGPRLEPGLEFGPGSTGSVLRTTLTGNGIGVRLNRSRGVHLDTVTVIRSRSDGLRLTGDQGTTLVSVHSQHNGGNGALVDGPSTDRPISGLDTLANNGFGLAIVRQNGIRISQVSTAADMGGGIRLTGTTGAVATDVSATDEPVGLLVNGASERLQLSDVRTDGGARGIVATGSVHRVDLASSQVTGAALTGVSISASDAAVRQVAVDDCLVGLRIAGHAARAAVSDTRISGGHSGVLIGPNTSAVTLSRVTTGVSGTGVSTAGPGTIIDLTRIDGGLTGINARAATTITASSVGGAAEGVHSGPGAWITGTRLDLLAAASGIKVEPGGRFVLTDSRVRAHVALRGAVTLLGRNTVSPPPFNWVGAFGVLFVGVALLLQLLHRRRVRRGVRTVVGPLAPVERRQARILPARRPLTARTGGSSARAAWFAATCPGAVAIMDAPGAGSVALLDRPERTYRPDAEPPTEALPPAGTPGRSPTEPVARATEPDAPPRPDHQAPTAVSAPERSGEYPMIEEAAATEPPSVTAPDAATPSPSTPSPLAFRDPRPDLSARPRPSPRPRIDTATDPTRDDPTGAPAPEDATPGDPAPVGGDGHGHRPTRAAS